eukprot:4936508-Pleurochrysis_carterae.AAC.1
MGRNFTNDVAQPLIKGSSRTFAALRSEPHSAYHAARRGNRKRERDEQATISVLEGLGSEQEEAATMRLLDLGARNQLVRGGQARMRARAHSRSRFAGGLDGGGERGRSGRFHGSLRNSQPVDKKARGLGPLPAAT